MTQYMRSMATRVRDQSGITGLETAIILIAFVVVASVFSFTVLSTGVFSSERGKEAVYAGLSEAEATMSTTGAITGIRGTVAGTNSIVKLKFVVKTAVTGEALDITPPNTTDGSSPDPDVNSGVESFMIISYSDGNQYIDDLDWTVDFIGKTNGDYILDEGEQAEITVWLHNQNGASYDLGDANNPQYLTTRLGINTKFRIEAKPGRGSSLVLERITPPRLQPVVDLS